jgi:hypothetical protein
MRRPARLLTLPALFLASPAFAVDTSFHTTTALPRQLTLFAWSR